MTNPYVSQLLDLLGDRDSLRVQSELLGAVEALVRPLDEATLGMPEAPGKWSVIEVVQHLADTELVVGYRYRVILAEDRPPLPAFDQERWTDELRYRHARLDDALGQLRALRDANLRLLRSVPDERLDRVGIHAERGEESVRDLARLAAGHDLVHRAQIERILETVRR